MFTLCLVTIYYSTTLQFVFLLLPDSIFVCISCHTPFPTRLRSFPFPVGVPTDSATPRIHVLQLGIYTRPLPTPLSYHTLHPTAPHYCTPPHLHTLPTVCYLLHTVLHTPHFTCGDFVVGVVAMVVVVTRLRLFVWTFGTCG